MRALSFAVAALAAVRVSAEETDNDAENGYFITAAPSYPTFMGDYHGYAEPRFMEAPHYQYVVEEQPHYFQPEPRYYDHPRYMSPRYEEHRARYYDMPYAVPYEQHEVRYIPEHEPTAMQYITAASSSPAPKPKETKKAKKVTKDDEGIKYVKVPEVLFEKLMEDEKKILQQPQKTSHHTDHHTAPHHTTAPHIIEPVHHTA